MVLVTEKDCQTGRVEPCPPLCSHLSLTSNCTDECILGRRVGWLLKWFNYFEKYWPHDRLFPFNTIILFLFAMFKWRHNILKHTYAEIWIYTVEPRLLNASLFEQFGSRRQPVIAKWLIVRQFALGIHTLGTVSVLENRGSTVFPYVLYIYTYCTNLFYNVSIK